MPANYRQPWCWLCLLFSLSVVPDAMSAPDSQSRPQGAIYLWAEKPLVAPDREHVKDQRVYAVDNPSMTPYWPEPDKANGTAVVIFPGGGYVRLALNNEGHGVAKWFAERGVAAFVVKYRMVEYGFPAPLLDGLRAVRLVRQNASDWGIALDKVGVIGFSAGGHLAASVTTRHDFTVDDGDPLAAISARPDFSILGYPVITLEGADAHAGSRKALLGENPDPALVHENSLQHQVTAEVPPVFMLHGAGDQSVPVTNSLAFFTEVQKFNKRSELHVYQSNIHGVGMIQGQGTISSWPTALELWLKQNNFLYP
ncbi:alpha/beta hydrolase [Cellvibrio japonicus]|uniref:Endo-1,4-beta-xylanase B n=1 Tax=Cellvibrio japonicus (strain Ueda107) TaxID=498211 RepID=B3PIU5_CELJU|nr:alpha/beta hydrolase [Cellvibrio japonicus]ACE84975.1 endo-1,4-beta-xylanase B [Cellvibrio japonicus Ueda107]